MFKYVFCIPDLVRCPGGQSGTDMFEYIFCRSGTVCSLRGEGCLLSVVPWRHVVSGLEGAVEGRLALETAVEVDIRDRPVAVCKKRGRMLKPDIVEIMVEILVKHTGKDPGECKRADSERL